MKIKNILIVPLLLVSTILIADGIKDWKDIAGDKADGSKIKYSPSTFAKIENNLIHGITQSVYKNRTWVKRETKINCSDKTIGYGLVVMLTNTGTEKTMYMAKDRWVFFQPQNSELKVIKFLCNKYNK